MSSCTVEFHHRPIDAVDIKIVSLDQIPGERFYPKLLELVSDIECRDAVASVVITSAVHLGTAEHPAASGHTAYPEQDAGLLINPGRFKIARMKNNWRYDFFMIKDFKVNIVGW